MLTVDEALQYVRRHARRLPGETCRVGEALGRVLDEAVASDIDSPPYDKSTVDGYALRAADLPGGRGTLTVVEQITAGEVPRRELAAGQTARIMTGAPLPAGADSVVMIERAAGGAPPCDTFPHPLTLNDPHLSVGQNILRRAQSLAAGQVVLAAGTALRAIELGLLSEVGRTDVRVVARPRVGVLPTGNELVPAGIRPGPGQIRNSNGPMLLAAVAEAGGVPVDLGVARDEPDDLRRRIAAGLECDVLVLSGGVSAGVLDLVPAALAELGVEPLFHKVQLKPGKPLWFGVRPANGGARRCLVFGLPGNPVSSLVCFELFVRAALDLLGGSPRQPALTGAQLTTPFVHRGDRPTWHPARWHASDALPPVVELLPWQGSGDLRTLSEANCLVAFEPGNRRYDAGQIVAIWKLAGGNIP